MDPFSRRRFLASGALAAGSAVLAPGFLRDALAAAPTAQAGAGPYGPLGAPDANDLMLPGGFRSRLVARGFEPVEGTGYSFPVFPDGQATYRTGDGGWILVTNSESLPPQSGVSAIRFATDGAIRSAYRILENTRINCAGGPTPWGTWLSCEEIEDGLVYECDPAGVLGAEARPALGVFKHEAAAVDPVEGRIYLTEDEGDGGFYRFTSAAYPDLSVGVLEVATIEPDARISWRVVPDPSTAETGVATRAQVPEMTRFESGEGIWYGRGVVYFTTKGDKKVWAYDIDEQLIDVLYDRELAKDSALDAVDNVTVTAGGDVYVCEDGGNQEIGLISAEQAVSPFLRFVGSDHEGSEVCGVCFDPSGTRMYLTSQRAFPVVEGGGDLPTPVIPGDAGPGAVYEVTGPFRQPPSGVPADFVYGPPAGEVRPGGPLNPGRDNADPAFELGAPRRVGRRGLLRRGIGVEVRSADAGRVSAVIQTHDLGRPRPGRGGSSPRPRSTVLGRAEGRVERDGTLTLTLRPPRTARRLLRRRRKGLSARVTVVVVDGAGNRRIETRDVRIGKRPGRRRTRRRRTGGGPGARRRRR